MELVEVIMVDCPRCGQRKPAHHIDKHICIDCSHAESNRMTYYRQHQGDWIAEAKEQGIPVWLQQPGETQWEYTVWLAYRDSYPGKKPSYGSVAEQLQTSYSAVRSIAQRWSFQPRMQVWIAECDRITLLQRQTEILDMNKKHIDMATALRDKLSTAIDAIVPTALKPGEIASLMKVSTDLERKARIDTIAQEEMRKAQLVDNANPALKQSPTKEGDIKEVLDILLKAGALGSMSAIGIRETTVREIVATGNSVMREKEEEYDED